MYLNDHYNDASNTFGNAGYIVANFFADALLVSTYYPSVFNMP